MIYATAFLRDRLPWRIRRDGYARLASELPDHDGGRRGDTVARGGGARGIVLTIWALNRLGVGRRKIAAGEATFSRKDQSR
jgi:hypothetical protein